MFLTEAVVGRTHGVEHTHNLHWTQARTHGCETDYVAEQDADRLELPAGTKRRLPIPELVGDRLRDHLVEKLVGFLDTGLQLGASDLLLHTKQ